MTAIDITFIVIGFGAFLGVVALLAADAWRKRPRLAPTKHGHQAGAVYGDRVYHGTGEGPQLYGPVPPDVLAEGARRAGVPPCSVCGEPGRCIHTDPIESITRGTFEVDPDEPPQPKEESHVDPDPTPVPEPPPQTSAPSPSKRPSPSQSPTPSFLAPVSSTLVKAAAHSAEEADHYLNSGRPDTKALRDGRLLHMAVLEPERYARHIIVSEAPPRQRAMIVDAIEDRERFLRECPAWDGERRTKAGREAWAELVAKHPDVKDTKDTIKQAELDAVLVVADAHLKQHPSVKWVEVVDPSEAGWHKAIVAALRRHPVAGPFLFNGDGANEVELDWVHPRTGHTCRTRADRIVLETLIDLKFMSEVSPGKFATSVAKYSYDVQMAFTADGAVLAGHKVTDVLVIAVQKGAPYLVAPYEFTEDRVLCHGREKYETGLDTLETLATSERTPVAYPEVIQINLPSYAQVADDDDLEDTYHG